MRRLASAIALASVAALGAIPATPAAAAPSLKLSVGVAPIDGFAGSGSSAGAGARLNVSLVIGGTEYKGSPPPLEHLDLTLPRGMRFSTAGFPRFPLSYFEEIRPVDQGCTLDRGPACLKGAVVGPETSTTGVVAFRSQLVPETGSVLSFDDSAGGTSLSIFGHEPALLEILARSAPVSPEGTAGETLHWMLPEVETAPQAPFMSFTGLAFNLGSARKHHHASHFTLVMPKTCHHGGMRFKMQAKFFAVGGLPGQSATATARAQCRHGKPPRAQTQP